MANASHIQDAFERFRSSKLRCALVAFVVTALLFAVSELAWVPNGVNDDWALSNGLSGNWQGSWGLCLFLNAVLTRCIYALNQAWPTVNWYFALECMTVYGSYLFLAYVALSRMKAPACFAALSVATVLLLPGSTFESNFTYVAGFASCAGATALVCSTAQERHGVALVALGLLLLLVGSLWRWTMFLLCVPAFGLAALYAAFAGRGQAGSWKKAARLWPFVVALALFGAFHAYDGSQWTGPWAEWLEFNDARSVMSDYPHESYDGVSDELGALGVSANDYRMLDSWMTEDPDFFTEELLEQVNDASISMQMSPSWVAQSTASYFKKLVTSPKLCFVLAALVVCIIACAQVRTRRIAVVLFFVTLGFSIGLLVLGRLPARVHYPLWAYAACAIGACTAAAAGSPEAAGKHAGPKGATGVRTVFSWLAAALPLIAVAFVLVVAIPHFRPARACAIVDEGSLQPSNYLLDYMRKRDDAIFVMNTSSNATLVFANLMVKPFDSALLEQTVSIGGWASRAPYALARNERIGMANPIRGLVDNEHAVYVAPGPKSADMLKTYLREHYYPDATYREVDVVEDAGSSDKVYVYKFSRA